VVSIPINVSMFFLESVMAASMLHCSEAVVDLGGVDGA
jgi:hypothetical protein